MTGQAIVNVFVNALYPYYFSVSVKKTKYKSKHHSVEDRVFLINLLKL